MCGLAAKRIQVAIRFDPATVTTAVFEYRETEQIFRAES
jgi:hypothetical protein